MRHAVSDELYQLLDESVDDYGYELVHLELVGRNASRTLRLYIDAPGSVTVDDCAFVSNRVSRLLDVENLLAGNYILEVSSPGIDRPLAKNEHFHDALAERVEVTTHLKIDNRRKFRGTLVNVSADTIDIEVTEGVVTIDFENIRKANLKPEFNAAMDKRCEL